MCFFYCQKLTKVQEYSCSKFRYLPENSNMTECAEFRIITVTCVSRNLHSNKQNCRKINTVLVSQHIHASKHKPAISPTSRPQRIIHPDLATWQQVVMTGKLDAPRKITDSYIGNPRLHILRKYNNNWADNVEVYYEFPVIILAVYKMYVFKF